jgi:hypothetical protein
MLTEILRRLWPAQCSVVGIVINARRPLISNQTVDSFNKSLPILHSTPYRSQSPEKISNPTRPNHLHYDHQLLNRIFSHAKIQTVIGDVEMNDEIKILLQLPNDAVLLRKQGQFDEWRIHGRVPEYFLPSNPPSYVHFPSLSAVSILSNQNP